MKKIFLFLLLSITSSSFAITCPKKIICGSANGGHCYMGQKYSKDFVVMSSTPGYPGFAADGTYDFYSVIAQEDYMPPRYAPGFVVCNYIHETYPNTSITLKTPLDYYADDRPYVKNQGWLFDKENNKATGSYKDFGAPEDCPIIKGIPVK